MKDKKFFSKVNKLKTSLMTSVFLMMTNINAYATLDGETQFDNVVTWLLGWIGKIGIVISIWGAVQISFSFSNEDAGQRRAGILQLISGLMCIAIGFGAKKIIGF